MGPSLLELVDMLLPLFLLLPPLLPTLVLQWLPLLLQDMVMLVLPETVMLSPPLLLLVMVMAMLPPLPLLVTGMLLLLLLWLVMVTAMVPPTLAISSLVIDFAQFIRLV